MVELVGDSSRDGRWALVRLEVEGDRIVGADADGLDRPLEGLTLLEAATVGGDELAVDALANALGPAFTATPDPGRVAVAMSGGVDSAVALLRAGPGAIGVTLRLWLDPRGPDAERAPRAHHSPPWQVPARARDRPGQGPVVHARPARPSAARADLVPARRADERGDPGRGSERRAGRGRPLGEPGGVLPGRRRLPR